jgi:hypothetical protein
MSYYKWHRRLYRLPRSIDAGGGPLLNVMKSLYRWVREKGFWSLLSPVVAIMTTVVGGVSAVGWRNYRFEWWE